MFKEFVEQAKEKKPRLFALGHDQVLVESKRCDVMNYENLKQSLMEYDWNDGFEVPQKILNDENCNQSQFLYKRNRR